MGEVEANIPALLRIDGLYGGLSADGIGIKMEILRLRLVLMQMMVLKSHKTLEFCIWLKTQQQSQEN